MFIRRVSDNDAGSANSCKEKVKKSSAINAFKGLQRHGQRARERKAARLKKRRRGRQRKQRGRGYEQRQRCEHPRSRLPRLLKLRSAMRRSSWRQRLLCKRWRSRKKRRFERGPRPCTPRRSRAQCSRERPRKRCGGRLSKRPRPLRKRRASRRSSRRNF